MALTEINVCNLALSRIGGTAITSLDIEVDTGAEAAQCALHYEPTRDALLRSHAWRFASMSVNLVRPTIATSGTSTGTNSATTLNDTGKAWTVNGLATYWLWITDGTGEGQIRLIASNTATRLTTTDDFSTEPDDTSIYEVWQFGLPFQDAAVTSGTSTGTNSTTTLNDTGKAWTVNAYVPTADVTYWLWIKSGTGANQIRAIVSNTATKLTITDVFTTTPDDTSVYEVWQYPSEYRWGYEYVLPSDFLRFVKTDPLHEPFEIAGTMLKSDEDSITIEYVRQETDPDVFDALFVDALVADLAAKLCMPLLHDKAWTDRLEAEAERILSQAKGVNLQEAETEPTRRTWSEARRGWVNSP